MDGPGDQVPADEVTDEMRAEALGFARSIAMKQGIEWDDLPEEFALMLQNMALTTMAAMARANAAKTRTKAAKTALEYELGNREYLYLHSRVSCLSLINLPSTIIGLL
jgi:hypothetical protein